MSRFAVVCLFLLLAPMATTPLHADDAVSAPECGAGVCVLNVLAPELASAPCAGYSVTVAYSQPGGATLIQCAKPATATEENKTFIYDRLYPTAKAFEVEGGRFIRPDSLATLQREGIPDRLGPVPLCPAGNAGRAASGGLTIARKRPTDSGNEPYCYELYRVASGSSGPALESEEGQTEPASSSKAIARWASLRRKLSRYIP